MSASHQSSEHAPRLADRLAAARRGRFVGREAELKLFRSGLLADEASFAVLHLYGPGGVGKTTLLHEYARLAAESGRPVAQLDGRNVEPSPPEFLLALRLALGLAKDGPSSTAPNWPAKGVLLIDTYETLAPLDAWLRESFLPQLPGQSLVVIAGRNPPATAWRTGLDWAELTRIVSLRNLRPEESQTYLTVREIPAEQHAEVLAFTHGHPLALSLVADALSQGDKLATFDPRDEPDVIRLLLERFTQRVPGPKHRRALEICAHVRVTTEALLAVALDAEEAHQIFEWLRGLSFIEQGQRGLFPHDLAREVLDADLRWRNPAEYQTMHRQVRRYYNKLLRQTQGQAQRLVMADMVYLYRHNPTIKSYWDWSTFGQTYTEPATAADHPLILETAQRHEGAASAEIVRYWLQRQPQAFIIFRSHQQPFIGFMAMLTLPAITAADAEADPAIAAAQRFIQSYGPLRPDEELDYVRFWMGSDGYQTTDIHNLVTVIAGTAWADGNPRRVWSFAAVATPDRWQPLFVYINFAYTQEADFTVAGQHFGVFSHYWRVEPVSDWNKVVGDRQLATDLKIEQAAPPAPLVVLSEPEFAEAVRQALRDYLRPDALVSNPLLRSRLVAEKTGQSPGSSTLQALIRQAAETLKANPKDEKFFWAIHHTYLEPAPTQEKAAERLDLPFNTYRYRLTNGLQRIVEWLWQRELSGFED